MNNQIITHAPFALVLIGGVAYSLRYKKLTTYGAIAGVACGTFIYIGTGWSGFILLTTFFVLGVAATHYRMSEKTNLQQANKEKHGRTADQVIANSGVAVLGTLAILTTTGYQQESEGLIAGSLAAALGDTWSSELGVLWGSRFVNILTFMQDERGSDGVVSVEGTIAGLAGSAIIAFTFCIIRGDYSLFPFILAGGLVGNLTDSWLGAFLERRDLIGNNMVNFLSTLTGGITSALLSTIAA